MGCIIMAFATKVFAKMNNKRSDDADESNYLESDYGDVHSDCRDLRRR